MWHFFHSYLSLLYRWMCQMGEDWALELVAEETSQYIESGAPAALPNALARLSPQNSKSCIQLYKEALYHNYYQI